MNILTFDVEEWYLRKERYGNDRSKYDELDNYLNRILDLLNERQIKGTFFCLGGLATEYPNVVRKIAASGHEVGCHSNHHLWLNKMTEAEVREDTQQAIDALEQCIGKKVKSYRAPAFSIDESNLWAFNILAENGIERDASVFPAARDFGGFTHFGHKTPVMINYQGVEIKEFPVCTTKLIGKELAYSGGGYFRFFPLKFVKREISKAEYAMTYFHIGDLIPESNGVMTKEAYEAYYKEPGTRFARYKRYFKSNLGKKTAFNRLLQLIETTDFISLEQADSQIDWNHQDVVEL